jgi:catechol 2,3-dioxygenase-like lactoylglutathione lyase family enzyme
VTPAPALNHVSVIARDLAESVAFYVDELGLRPIATPNFGFPVQWLAAGDRQVHVFEQPGDAPSHAHFALEIEEFLPVYRRMRACGALDATPFRTAVQELPNGTVQLYVRDPAGNLLELDYRGDPPVPRDEVPEYTVLADRHPQGPENAGATLFHA